MRTRCRHGSRARFIFTREKAPPMESRRDAMISTTGLSSTRVSRARRVQKRPSEGEGGVSWERILLPRIEN